MFFTGLRGDYSEQNIHDRLYQVYVYVLHSIRREL